MANSLFDVVLVSVKLFMALCE